ncbi:hypothetical protein [Brevundimonas sp. LjRoot202]|uniref:hypothetical protein n=1 Tax=Brevundimonas sp. LjRoot202 TaxID=3342281 RepID=UPI003ECD0B06
MFRIRQTIAAPAVVILTLAFAGPLHAQDRWAPWRAFEYGDEMATAVSVPPGQYLAAATADEPPRVLWLLSVPAQSEPGESAYTEQRIEVRCGSRYSHSLGHADFDARGRKLSEFEGIADYWVDGASWDVVRWICEGTQANPLGPTADTSLAFARMYRAHLARTPRADRSE